MSKERNYFQLFDSNHWKDISVSLGSIAYMNNNHWKDISESFGSIANVNNHWKDISESFGSIAYMNNNHWKDIREAFGSIANVNNHWKDISVSLGSIALRDYEQISKISQVISNIIEEDLGFNYDEIEVEDNSTLVYYNERVPILNALNELNLLIKDIINFPSAIVEKISDLKKESPTVFILLVFFLLSPIQAYYNNFIINTINSNLTSVVSNNESSSLQRYKINKLIQKEINSSIKNIEERRYISNNFRYVDTEVLNVRFSNSNNSRIVGKLYFGQVIRVIQKNKNWTLIEYTSENDEVYIRGWVFTRYIKRFD